MNLLRVVKTVELRLQVAETCDEKYCVCGCKGRDSTAEAETEADGTKCQVD